MTRKFLKGKSDKLEYSTRTGMNVTKGEDEEVGSLENTHDHPLQSLFF